MARAKTTETATAVPATPESTPTLPPTADVDALAEATRHSDFVPVLGQGAQGRPPTPLESLLVDDASRLVPAETRSRLSEEPIGFDEAAVLAHLDGVSDVAQIAELLDRPRDEVRAILHGLAARGLVCAAPHSERSGTKRRTLPET
jgi:hypothetical protein